MERTPEENMQRLRRIAAELVVRDRRRICDMLSVMGEWGGVFDCAKHNPALGNHPFVIFGLMIEVVQLEKEWGITPENPSGPGWSDVIRDISEAVVAGDLSEARFVEIQGGRWIDP